MKGSRFSESQIFSILREAESDGLVIMSAANKVSVMRLTTTGNPIMAACPFPNSNG